MPIIYKPKGKALEYAPLACNLVVGCRFGCTYCYNPMILRMSREEFSKPRIKPNVLEQLAKEAPKYAGKEIFMSFSTDPFQGIREFDDITNIALLYLFANDITVRLLTKSAKILNPKMNFYPQDKIKYGATLVYYILSQQNKYEPNAPHTFERIVALSQNKKDGYYTWVSLEPVVDPMQSLLLIEETHEFVDEYRIGAWNYSPEAKKIDNYRFVNEAKEVLEKYGKKYMFKESLKKYIRKDTKQ